MEYKEAIKILGISYSTLQRWVARGRIRTSDYQFGKYSRKNYFDEDVHALVGRKVQTGNQIIAYFRMNRNNKESRAKMQEQKKTVRMWCAARGVTVDQEIEDWHTGVDYGVTQRPGFHEIIQQVMKGTVDAIVVDAEDRLTRIGIEVFHAMFKYYGTHFLVVNKGITDPYYQNEQSEDITKLLENAKIDRIRQE